MSTALDLYATTNPAFGCALLASYLSGAEEAGQSLEFPLLFLPMPILLSSLRGTLAHTNRKTGFYPWIERHPELSVGLAARVERMSAITRRSVLYGARIEVIAAGADGRFRASGALRETALARTGEAVRPLFPLARRLGLWIGEVGSTRDVLYALGLTV
ncbi:MAG: three component ABC system middle component [Gemmatimonas sp.]